MRKVLYILALALLIGNASAILDLSGTDFNKAFSNPSMANDGVSKDVGSVTWGTPAGWNDASDGTPAVEGRTILSLGLVHYDRIGILNSEDIIEPEEVLNTSVNNTLNTTLNATEAI